MSRMRVLDLAKELGLDSKTAISKLQELGIQVKNHFNALSDAEAEKLRSFSKSGRNPDKDGGAKAANRVLIRRRADTASASAPENVQAVKESADLLARSVAESGLGSTSVSTPVQAAPAHQPDAPEPRAGQEGATAPRSVETSADAPRVEPTAAAKPQQESAPTSMPPAAAANAPAADSAATPPSTTSPEAAQPTPSTTPAPAAATLVKRAPLEPSATIVRPASTIAQGAREGAVIVRRGPDQQSGAPGSYGSGGNQGGPRYGGAQGQQGPGQYGGSGPTVYRPQGQQGQGGQTYTAGGGYFRDRDGAPGQGTGGPRPYTGGAGYQGGGGGYQGSGGYQPRPGGPGAGGYQGGAPRPGGPGMGARPPYGAGPGGPGAPRYGAAPGATGGYGPRPGGPGMGPRPPFGAGPAGAAGPGTDAPAGGRDASGRPVRDWGRDKQKARPHESDDRGARARGARADGTIIDDEVLAFDADYTSEAPEGESQVRTVILPNRKRGGPSMRSRRDHKKQEPANPMRASKRVVKVDDNISVADLAGEMSVKSSMVVKALMKLGMMAGVNQRLDLETATLVATEFGFEVQNSTVDISDILNTKKSVSEDTNRTESKSRPPVVTIMGHVDHGKTSLLDAIRKANVADKEAGGITQAIGAYQVESKNGKVTFLDTPGHEAFTAMRSRGAKVTDIVVLVVAADDGVMPQTIEAIAHAKAANVPIIVAINKIDKPGANLDRIQRELAEQQVMSEEWGGESMFVKVSAKTKEGVPELLESILLQAEVLDLKAPEEGLASGIVIEAKLDKARGPVATLLVSQGTLKVSDTIVAGIAYGRVRAMLDDKGQKVTSVGPATPVEIIGLSEVPRAGDSFNCVVNEAIAKEAVAYRIEKQRQKDFGSQPKASLEDLMARLAEDANKVQELPIILKADTQGSVEAIRAAVTKLDTGKVRNKILLSGVGGITETDITLAHASQALVVGFNVRPDRMAAAAAERDHVSVQLFDIIYKLIENVQTAMAGKLAPVKTEKVIGHAEVRQLISVPKVGVISGSAVTDGKMQRGSGIRVVRDGIVVFTGRIGSLRRFKEDAKEVLQGFECGIGVENYNDLKVGDVLEGFIIEETAATL